MRPVAEDWFLSLNIRRLVQLDPVISITSTVAPSISSQICCKKGHLQCYFVGSKWPAGVNNLALMDRHVECISYLAAVEVCSDARRSADKLAFKDTRLST
jgi:hypothetical protein